LLANLELAAAVTEFTRTGEINAGSGRFVSEFLDWLQQRPKLNQDFPECQSQKPESSCLRHS
jgi:hypothetical protein